MKVGVPWFLCFPFSAGLGGGGGQSEPASEERCLVGMYLDSATSLMVVAPTAVSLQGLQGRDMAHSLLHEDPRVILCCCVSYNLVCPVIFTKLPMRLYACLCSRTVVAALKEKHIHILSACKAHMIGPPFPLTQPNGSHT